MSRRGLQYLACMLSGAAVVALLGGAAASSGHHAADLPALLWAVLAMAGAGVPAGWLLFRPIERYLAAAAGVAPPAADFHRLPRRSALCIYALTALTVGWHAGASHGSWQAIAAQSGELLLTMLAHVALFAGYIALYAHLLVSELLVALRLDLWRERQWVLPPRGKGLAARIAIGFAAVAAAPLLLAFADQAVALHHPFVRQALQMDLLAAALLVAMLVILEVRGLQRPVRTLLDAMERVDRGDLAARAAVVSDDELGALTARFNRMLDALGERDRMRRTFSRFVPEEVAAALLADEGAIEPQLREASVLYADIERFTSVAGALQPAEILRMLNAYFAEAAHIIHGHGGVIAQFQGDAVLAGFNLPAALPDHALRAVEAALELQARLDALRLAGGIRLRMRIGVATGEVVGGTVGGEGRLGYTLHGDTVNRAARLEELNKELGTRVLIDGRTAELLEHDARLRDHGAEALRGFAVPVRVYEPLYTPVRAAHA